MEVRDIMEKTSLHGHVKAIVYTNLYYTLS